MAVLRKVTVEQQGILLDAAKERADIVAKYDRGREEGAQIDPWEDPDLPLYHVTDRYGFIHETKLSSTKTVEENKAIETEMRRTDKWLTMFKKWDKFSTVSREKLKERVYKGIPDKIRSQAWTLLLEVEERKSTQRGIYEKMKQRAREWSPDLRQIDLDVNRTYRDHMMFRRRYDVKQRELFNVLAAYSMYNTEVGYCQGMSQIAALLLMYMHEEESFWALSELMTNKRHAMHGFFIPQFPKLMRFQEHFDVLLRKYLPKLKKHLDDLDIMPSLYSVKWFLQCFLDRVPFPMTLRLWDIYLLEGEKLLVAMSLTIMKLHNKKLLKLDMEGLVHVLQVELERDFGYPESAVIDTLQTVISDLERAKLLFPPITKEIQEAELPTKPFGLFVPPSVEQLIGRRTLETEIELLSGRHTVLSPSAFLGYPDRGPSLQHVHNRMSLLITSGKFKQPSIDGVSLEPPQDIDETGSTRSSVALDHANSRLSVSQTSDDASTMTSGSRLQLSPQRNSLQNNTTIEEDDRVLPPSRASEYDNVDAREQLNLIERELEKTLELMNKEAGLEDSAFIADRNGETVFGINGHWAGARPPSSPGWTHFPLGPPKSPQSSNGRLSNGNLDESRTSENSFIEQTSSQRLSSALSSSSQSDVHRTTNL